MKKFVVVLVLLLAASTVFAAGPIEFPASFQLGQWLDPNYNVIWDFSSDNIRILSKSGAVLYNFNNKTIEDFKVGMSADFKPAISFKCPEAGRSYNFIVQQNLDLVMEIVRPNEPDYSVEMPKQ